MGVITKILSGVLNFIQGLIGGIGKTLGVGKSQYFMELSDDDAAANDEAAPPAVAAAPAETTSNGSATKADLDVIKPTSDAAKSIQSPAQPRAKEPAASTVMVASSATKEATKEDSKASDNSSMTFAPNFLLNRSTTGGRRRPGPSLNPFKDMVKDMDGAG